PERRSTVGDVSSLDTGRFPAGDLFAGAEFSAYGPATRPGPRARSARAHRSDHDDGDADRSGAVAGAVARVSRDADGRARSITGRDRIVRSAVVFRGASDA